MMKGNKIWIIASSQIPIPPRKGGAIEKIIKNIHDSRDDIFVVSCCATDDNVRYVTIPSKRIRWPLSLFYEIYWGFKIFVNIVRHRPSVVHFNTLFNSIIPFMLRFFVTYTKFVYTSHNPSWTTNPSYIGFINKVILIAEKIIMNASDFTTAVSAEMYRGYIKHGVKKRSKIIYNVVDDVFFSPQKITKNKFGLRGKIVLYVGKLTDTKGFPLLLEAIKNLDVTLLVVGGKYYGYDKNPYDYIIRKLSISDKVVFLGSVDEEDLPDIYSMVDLFVFPTKKEAFGMVAVESICCGTPVVASNIPVLREVLNGSAVFFRPGDVDDLSSKIKEALTIRFDKNTLNNTCKKFSKKRILRQWRKFYEEVIHGP